MVFKYCSAALRVSSLTAFDEDMAAVAAVDEEDTLAGSLNKDFHDEPKLKMLKYTRFWSRASMA